MIREIGEVVAGGKTATVKIDRKKECDGCKMCSRRRGDNYVKMRADNTLGAKVGDKVEVRIEKAFTLQASALVYLLPLLFATIGLLVGFFTLNEKYAFGLPASSTVNYSSCVRQTSNGSGTLLEFSMKSDVKADVLTSKDLINWEKMNIAPATIGDGFSNYKVNIQIPEGGKIFFKLEAKQK